MVELVAFGFMDEMLLELGAVKVVWAYANGFGFGVLWLVVAVGF